MATSVEVAEEHVFAVPQSVEVRSKLNVRARPTRAAERVARLEPGARLTVDRWVVGETFLGVDRWFKVKDLPHYIWAGGAEVVETPAPAPGPGAASMQVRRRNDSGSTIMPLAPDQITPRFGDLAPREISPPGAIEITAPGWKQNLVNLGLAHPAFPGNLVVHAKAKPSFEAVFTEIANRGLSDRIRTCGGTFVARHIGWNPAKPLSSHSWGIAIDLNERWNGYGKTPALPGEVGSVRELVPIFAVHGFAWGGHFSTPDGMHFELARLDI